MSSQPAINAQSLSRCGQLESEFEMGRLLGLGGTSEVRVAYQASRDRCVAVKVATSPFGEKALRNEARVASRLQHPSIASVLAVGRDARGRAAVVMPLVVGRTWRQFITPAGLTAPSSWVGDPLSWHLGVLCQVAEALSHAHAAGIIHRDIKPSNVMIDRHGQVFVMDWGIAAALGGRHPDLPQASSVARFVGTPGYAAPEMVDTRTPLIGECTDVYQLGACLHAVLTGGPPHTHPRLADRLRSALVSAPASYPATAPARLVAICHRAMARRPADRFASMADLGEALRAARLQVRSIACAREGWRHLIALRRQIAEGRDGAAFDEAFAEARRIFRQALRYWPRNTIALDGYQSLCEAVICRDIAHGGTERARSLLGELPQARPDLEAQLDEPADPAARRVYRRPALALAPSTSAMPARSSAR